MKYKVYIVIIFIALLAAAVAIRAQAGEGQANTSLWILGYIDVQSNSNETIRLIYDKVKDMEIAGVRFRVVEQIVDLIGDKYYGEKYAQILIMMQSVEDSKQEDIKTMARMIRDNKIITIDRGRIIGSERTSAFTVKELNSLMRRKLEVNKHTNEWVITRFKLKVKTREPINIKAPNRKTD